MGKISKIIQPKHKETLSPWLSSFVEQATSTPLHKLPTILATFPSKWPFPRGDLYHWIPLLNRFDGILDAFCSAYRLNDGPQSRDFGLEVLLKHDLYDSGDGDDQQKQPSEEELLALGYSPDGDRQLIITVLKFTQMLLDRCGNRSIYASSSFLNDILNSTDLAIVCATLEVGVELAQRYQASVKRMGVGARQIHTALLSNHYNIDLERVQNLAQPFVKTPIVKPPASSVLTTPTSAAKNRDKISANSSKNAAVMFANDLCAIAKPDSVDASGPEARWNGWGDVKITYYPVPSAAPQSDPAPQPTADRSSTTVPSTPTPLRRSNTAFGSQSTPRSARQSAVDDSPISSTRSPLVDREATQPPGQKSLEVTQSTVVSSTIYDLVNRLPGDLPVDARYEYLNRLRVAKAMSGSLEARQLALKARLLAVQNLAYIHTEQTFTEKVLRQDQDEPRRFQLVYQLAELIHPPTEGGSVVPLDLQAIAFSLLEVISSFNSKLADTFTALNATVNHGVLLYVIRTAVADMTQDDSSDQWTIQDEWREKLLQLTIHITLAMAHNSTRNVPEIISAGLLDIVVEVLNLRSSIAEQTYGTLVNFLDQLIYTASPCFQPLVNANGLDAITNLITHEVALAQKLASDHKGTPMDHRSQVVDYEIPFHQQQNLKFLMKFIHHLMGNAYAFGGNSDRLLRNLVDKSDLLDSFRHVIENSTRFGSLVWTNATSILADFLNNDPTSFAAISESGLIQCFLQTLTGRPVTSESAEGQDGDADGSEPGASDIIDKDNRPHPPTQDILNAPREAVARGILPASDAITVIPTILNAISLNNQGMRMVLTSQAFDSFFEIFESPKHVRVMSIDLDMVHSVGASFDELARHHPDLRPAISNAVIDMVSRVTHLANTKSQQAGWGVSMLSPNGPDSQEQVRDGDADNEKSKANDEGDVTMTDAIPAPVLDAKHGPEDLPSPQSSVTPYILAVTSFLNSYITNMNLKQSLVAKGGVEILLDLSTASSLPYNFAETSASKTVHVVLSHLVETLPIRGLPCLLKRAGDALDTLQPVVGKQKDGDSFFAPFTSTGGSLTQAQVDEATVVAKELLNIQTLVKILCSCFPVSNRSSTVSYHAINVFDYFQQLVKALGPMLRTVILEERAISNSIPSHWSSKNQIISDKDAPDSGSGNDQNTAFHLHVDDSGLPEIFTALGKTPNRADGASSAERGTSHFKNYETVRTLLASFTSSLHPLFSFLGKALLTRRERDQYMRAQHVGLADSLAKTILEQIDIPDRERTEEDYKYWMVMLHTVLEMLVDRKLDGRHSERNNPIIIPVVVAFKNHGGLEKLNSLLRVFRDEICDSSSGTQEATSLAKSASFCMKRILDLYSLLVHGKMITDSVGHVNVLPRNGSGSDRRAESLVAPNLLVELRMAILPTIRELWDSPLVEKDSEQNLEKITTILKLISGGDNESHAYRRRDGNKPPAYLQASSVRFPWADANHQVKKIKESVAEFPDDLILEALYRANANKDLAIEYCRFHTDLNSTRHPIPEADLPTDAETEQASSSESTTAPATDNEPALWDLAPDFPRDMPFNELGELRQVTSTGPDASGNATTEPADTHSRDAQVPKENSSERPDAVAVEDLDEARSSLRENLIDRCLDVIRAHPDSTHDIADLITALLLRNSGDESSSQEIGETLVNALMSFADDDDVQSNGRSVAAYTHLLCLLLQDKGFFKATIATLKDAVGQLLQFLRASASSTSEELLPWTPYVLLVFEILLSEDEKPADIKWKVPTTEDEVPEALEWPEKDLNVGADDRQTLLTSVLEILPRVGKAESVAVSLLRILVILTRSRTIAQTVGDKKNLQRLFVMTKQLSSLGSSRLNNCRITSHLLMVLRHIIEDEETVKQLMRSEIRQHLESPRSQRPPDVGGFVRQHAHIALRDPRLFVEVANDMIKITRWSPVDGATIGRHVIGLKELKSDASRDDVTPTVRATEDLSIQDIKPSTEAQDKQMTDDSKPAPQDIKRPVLENPDGVIHFLLCELLNYKEVEDKDHVASAKDSALSSDGSPAASGAAGSEPDTKTPEAKDKKGKAAFKPEDHPIFIYRCFLLHCLTELLQGYNRTKVEFINFKRSAPLQTNTPIKPRTSVLNYLLIDLLAPSSVEKPSDSLVAKKRATTASHAQSLLVALVSKTGEKPAERGRDKFDYDDEPDLLFVRKFVLDTILRSYRESSTSSDSFESRYERMLALAEVMYVMMGEKDKDTPLPIGAIHSADRSQVQIRRLMYEKGYLAALTTSIADIDLAYPPVKRTIKCILRVLRILTSTAIQLSHSRHAIEAVAGQNDGDDDIASATSISDLEEDREETPDLYRNSALGMMEPGRDMHEDYYSEDSDEEDEEMYDEEYDDEMDYDDGQSEDREIDVSDEDDDDDADLGDMGPIEGLSGDIGVVEVSMEHDEDDDEDEDEDDDMDEDDDDEDEDDDDLESHDVDDDRIEIIDDEGNPLEDDGASGWESEVDEDEDIDYELEGQDIDEGPLAPLHDINENPARIGEIMRAIEEDFPSGELHNAREFVEVPEEYEEDEDEEEDMDDEYAYEDDYPSGPPPPHMGASNLGWDTLVVEPGAMLGHHSRHLPRPGGGVRSPFPALPFMMGSRGDPLTGGFTGGLGDLRLFAGHQNDRRPNGNDDGTNPLLRRGNESGRDGSSRSGSGPSRYGGPGGLIGGGHVMDNPMALLNEVMMHLPHRGGQALHFQITQGPRGELREFSLPLDHSARDSRSDRRETYYEPNQATAFSSDSTAKRWQEEARLIFGSSYSERAHPLVMALLAYLVPPAMEHEKELKAREAEAKRKQEEARKMLEEEERREREAKEAEEKAAREKKEAEERERALAEASRESQDDSVNRSEAAPEPEAMEGVEVAGESVEQTEAQVSPDQPRALTTIRGEQVDVTELGIDADYLEALPEEFREEVIAQAVSSRRAQAREAPRGGGEQTRDFQEFLDALPDELRMEIVQQERADQRRRDREENRRQTGQAAEATDMDTASILMSFPPALRDQVLRDQGPDIMDSLPPDLAARARGLRPANVPSYERGTPGNASGADTLRPDPLPDTDGKPLRKTVVQMLDKAGVATLLRLMFINIKSGSLESSLKHVLKDVCENRQNRFEVISTLLQILQDGTTDLDAVERSFAHLSIKARQPKEKDTRTPQSLKRSLTTVSNSNSIQTSSETSPLLIVQQCLDLLGALAETNVHVPSLFLTEHDVSSVSLKRTLSRKGKGKESKAQKYPVNSLLALLDRELVMESSTIMDSLSQLLSRVTMPLLALERRQKEAVEALKKLEEETSQPQEQVTGREPEPATQDEATESQSVSAGNADADTARPPSGEADPTIAMEKKQALQKKIKHLRPPEVPVHNLTRIVNIFVARECSSRTFKETLSTIKNLSAIPDAMLVFGKELAHQAQVLSERIVVHLDELLPHIESATSGTEIQGVALSKFSPGASDQNKLLRVLMALDHLFAQKKSGAEPSDSAEETQKQDLLASLYRNTTINALWARLSACLSAIRKREGLLNIATILLPLIEALMVVCKHTGQTEPDESQSQQSNKEMLLSSPPPESQIASLFFTFTEEHRRILNDLVRSNPSLMKGTFSHLVKNPKVLEFDNKRNWFNRSIHNKSQLPHGRGFPTLQLQVRREHVFHDSFRHLYFKSGEEMKFGKLNIRFHGEEGVDAGGVTREWFQVLARQMFDPNYALFVPVSSDRTTFHPNKLSSINEEHLMFFKFIGRIIGKALYEGRLLDCYFSRAVYKRILGKQVSVKDMESFDPDYYKSLVWMLENDITDIITETFSVENDEFGVTKVEDLCENGRDIPVTEENKQEYVRLVVEHKLLSSVREQMDNFLKGFHEIIPAELISIFNEQELELLISGLPDIDIDDWKSNTEYHNYTASSQQIQWFWRAVRSFDKEELAKLVQFVTGTSKVPLNGFKELEGMNGINRFNIHRDYGNKDRLPSSHTCFNQLDLPEYESYDHLRKQLYQAITAGSEGFGFA